MSRQVKFLVFVSVFVFTLLAVAAAYTLKRQQSTPARKLDVFGLQEVDSTAADGTKHTVARPHRVGNFSFQDQNGQVLTQAQVQGRVYVADFIFTTCQTICPPMSRNMAKVVSQFKGDDRVRFISHTVDPETDSISILKAYADLHHAPQGQWYFATGSKKALYDMARYQYFVTATQGDGGPDDFIHTQNFVLVDTRGYIRGHYDGTLDEEMAKLVKDIKILEEEGVEN